MSYFFRNPDKEIYMSMLKNDLGKNLSSYQKELDNLVGINFILEKRRANLRIFSLNTSFVFYAELKRIFYKTELAGLCIRDALSKIGDIEYAFMYEKSVSGMVATKSLLVVVCDGCTKIIEIASKIQETLAFLTQRVDYRLYRRCDVRDLIRNNDEEMVYAVNATKEMILDRE
ncbi:MAG: hypothetical protein DKM50_12130 [Candidatus Margulisiibacteriota bacterium]|nr:MAG: hypothetical protein A2X43_00925 [Candidatus Margulisbacteria bacterium GWD2_39_127]OGI02392.1 MAG: hypothetical protein A2X42_09575 [Candidatus Margulisbacteria bacterium GWF2_38_17]OGI08524.1 MAG: hypothetical protein A2X41_07360 [Candidatus Margulisbacteria bacterium GWE2_39_32]PZM78174.1 MAG: hypothetical protein DKM50_12130 [Candidatus Margulisiibacteriota bacterium]HAR63435.1 hypothetical protein [Candidatus Margulisiibacteriota bacterium]